MPDDTRLSDLHFLPVPRWNWEAGWWVWLLSPLALQACFWRKTFSTHPHGLNGHEFEQTLGDSEGQGSLACCNSWGLEELDVT